jgi:hypothetical protein
MYIYIFIYVYSKPLYIYAHRKLNNGEFELDCEPSVLYLYGSIASPPVAWASGPRDGSRVSQSRIVPLVCKTAIVL